MNSYLLDTNVIIDWLRGHDPTCTWLAGRVQAGMPLYISGVTVAELFVGFSENTLDMRDRQLAVFRFLPLTYPVARLAGQLSRRHRRRGAQIPLPDLLQASCAQAHDLTVATSNQAHFPDVVTINPRLLQDARAGIE